MEPKTILVVDDDNEFRELLEDILTQAQYEVITAKNGQEGFETAKAKKPDLILMDVEMPLLDGYGACKAIRSDPETLLIPVIFCTVHSKVDQVVKGLKAGGNDHITKPFDPREVLLRVESTLKQAQGPG